MNDAQTIFVIVASGIAGFILYFAAQQFLSGFRSVANTRSQADSRKSKFRNNSKRRTQNSESECEQTGVKTWYEILEVAPSASLLEVKLAYRRKISLYHPDRTQGLAGELRDLADLRSKEINAAYEVALSSCQR